MLKVIILFLFIKNAIAQCDFEKTVDITNGTRLPDGGIDFENIQFKRTEYIVQRDVIRGCVCAKKTCILKCCPQGYGYNIYVKSCVKSTSGFEPLIKDEYLRNHKDSEKHFYYEIGKPNCSTNEFRITLSEILENFHLRTDGKLYVEVPSNIPPWMLVTPDNYCIDTFVNDNENGGKVSKMDALVCFKNEQEKKQYILGPTCMLISCVFILVTVAVYAWLPELRNLHGRVLMAYLLCLLVAFLCLATMQILLTIDNIGVNTCIVLSIFIYFSLLAAFFWLNVMSFDIWWTFSGKRGITRERMSIRTKFWAYALYAFSIPTVLTILLISLEFSGLPPNPFLPLLRYQGCFLYGKSKLLYLYFPMVVICISNTIFFILTARKITEIKKETSVLKSKESATHDQQNKERQRLLLYLKLFVIMGINWLLEVISAWYPDAKNFWCFTDAYNVLIGLIIFIIFVCKRKIFYLLKKRYKEMRGETISRSQTTCSRTLSTTRDELALTTRNEVALNNTKTT